MTFPSSTAAETPSYEDRVRGAFARLKRAPSDLRLPAGGALVPVAERHEGDAALIAQLGRWREGSAFAFHDQVRVSAEGTTRWLRLGLLDRDDRMLWLVTDGAGRALGHAGFANALNDRRDLEVDNVIRGEPGSPGIMAAAVHALVDWAHAELHPAEISLRVLPSNEHALRFYTRLGFREERRISLDGEPLGRELIRMVLREQPSRSARSEPA